MYNVFQQQEEFADGLIGAFFCQPITTQKEKNHPTPACR
jgi:hypothetical protein